MGGASAIARRREGFETARKSSTWFVEQRGVNDLDIYSNEQLDEALKELIKYKGSEAHGQAWFDAEYGALFTAAVPGAYYAEALRYLEGEKRIAPLEIDKSVPLDSAWNLGVSDSTAIWFIQQIGRDVRLVDYYETSGAGAHYYAEVLHERRLKHGYKYGRHYFPHDLKQREWTSGKSRFETLLGLGVEPEIVPIHAVEDGINATRRLLDRCWIDPDRCERGLEALRNYVREWSDAMGDYRASPKHSWASHGADALRIYAMGAPDASLRPSPQDRSRSWSSPAPSSHWAA
jgi:hypothetical protein